MLHRIKIRKNKATHNPSGQRWALLIQWLCSSGTFSMNVDELLLVYLFISFFHWSFFMLPQYICVHKVIFLLLRHLLFSCTLLFSPSEKGFARGLPPDLPLTPSLLSLGCLPTKVSLLGNCQSLTFISTNLPQNFGRQKRSSYFKRLESQTWPSQGKELFTWLWTISRGESITSLVCSGCYSFCPGNFASGSACELQCSTVLASTPRIKAFDGIAVLCSSLWLLVCLCGF